jgi:hypothetical protein
MKRFIANKKCSSLSIRNTSLSERMEKKIFQTIAAKKQAKEQYAYLIRLTSNRN